ncbi:MAG: phage holin family protein [Deltaproteobacteria bacterium]|nr:phage holin family protein [Deltaproteobacteria bacterium]
MLTRWILNSAGFLTAILIVPGIHVQSTDQWHLIGIALVAGAINSILGPIFKFFTFPMVFFTLGLWLWIANMILFWFAGHIGQQFGFGFTLDGFMPTFLGALIVSAVNLIFGSLFRSSKDK